MIGEVKRCASCKEDKPVTEYAKLPSSSDGLTYYCITCRRRKNRESAKKHAVKRYAQQRLWRESNKETVAGYHAKWREQNREQAKQADATWRTANPEKRRQACANYRVEHAEQERKYRREYNKANRGDARARLAIYRAKKRKAKPQWYSLTDARVARDLYRLADKLSRETGKPWHVDHIIPLQGKTVSGLHVGANLRVVPAELNLRKANKLLDACSSVISPL